MNMCPEKIYDALLLDAEHIDEMVHRTITESGSYILKQIPEGGPPDMTLPGHKIFDIRPRTNPICLVELSSKGPEFLRSFWKSMLESFFNWGVQTLQDTLQSTVIRYGGANASVMEGELVFSPNGFAAPPDGELSPQLLSRYCAHVGLSENMDIEVDSSKCYFGDTGNGNFQIVRLYPDRVEQEPHFVPNVPNHSYHDKQIVVEGVSHHVCGLALCVNRNSFQRSGGLKGSRYFEVCVRREGDLVTLVPHHKFALNLLRPELSGAIVYLPNSLP